MAINWNLLGPPVNPGEKFTQAFQAGQEQVRARQAENALGAVIRDPGNTEAFNALSHLNPKAAMVVQERVNEQARTQREAQQKDQERLAKTIGHLAKGAKTPEMWDASVDYLVSIGVQGAAEYKGKFTPEARAALMARAGVDDTADRDPAQVQMYEWLKANRPDLAEAYIRGQTTDPPRYFAVPQGGRLELDPSYTGPTTAPVASSEPVPITSPEERDALPPGSLYIGPDGKVRKKGGAGPSGPQTFP